MSSSRFISTHGHAARTGKSVTYRAWESMRKRCNNPAAANYKWYGGRGIKVCERWSSYENFLADMAERPAGMSLDRHPDNNGNYEPGNCRWATRSEQQRNTSTSRLIEYLGKTKALTAWCEELGLNYHRVWHRIVRGKWSVERAFTAHV